MSSTKFATVTFIAMIALAASSCGSKDAPQVVTADAKPSLGSQPNQAPGQSAGQSSGQGQRGGPNGKQEGRQGNGARDGGFAPLVVTVPVRKASFASEVEALGTAKANEAIDITAKVSNRVKSIGFREGQNVRAGEILVQLDPEEVAADLAVAEAALTDSKSQVKRSRELFITKALSAQQMEQLESTMQANEAKVASARARLNDQTIRAPFSGRVGLRNISVGSFVNTGTVITTLDDLSTMKVDFSVPETFLSVLKEGLEIQASTTAYAGEVFRGTVMSMSSRVDPVSRSVLVRGLLTNREGKLKPGMFMTVRLKSANIDALVIPEQALVPERDKQFVFAVRDGKAFKAEIVVGRRRPGEVEILKGLQLGDMVITEGTQKVRDGGAVQLAGLRGES